jgi:uncharacterized damage-inducible protein DinB
MSNPGRPQPGEHAPYFSRYIDLVPEEDIIGTIEAQGREMAALLSPLGEEKAAFRYAPEKWSVKQVLGHVTDAERIFDYRLLSIARGETKSLPGFDENDYMRGANFDQRSFADLLDDFDATRRATLTLLRGLSDEAWTRSGMANDNKTSARAVAYTVAGHARHHLGVLRSRYL